MTSDVAAGVPLAVQQIQRFGRVGGARDQTFTIHPRAKSRVMASPFLDLRYLFGW